jgi:hypothetical protein
MGSFASLRMTAKLDRIDGALAPGSTAGEAKSGV